MSLQAFIVKISGAFRVLIRNNFQDWDWANKYPSDRRNEAVKKKTRIVTNEKKVFELRRIVTSFRYNAKKVDLGQGSVRLEQTEGNSFIICSVYLPPNGFIQIIMYQNKDGSSCLLRKSKGH